MIGEYAVDYKGVSIFAKIACLAAVKQNNLPILLDIFSSSPCMREYILDDPSSFLLLSKNAKGKLFLIFHLSA